MPDKQPYRFLSVRLTDDELTVIYRNVKQSGCRSLTEFVIKVLTEQPATRKVHPTSLNNPEKFPGS